MRDREKKLLLKNDASFLGGKSHKSTAVLQDKGVKNWNSLNNNFDVQMIHEEKVKDIIQNNWLFIYKRQFLLLPIK